MSEEHREIDLSNSEKKILVDEDIYSELSKWTWYLHEDGSACRRKSLQDGTRTNWIERMHREIMQLQKGDRKVVDHINGNRLDNRKSNLRICTTSQNMMNARIKKSSKTGLKGVTRTAQKMESYTAYIRYNGKKYSANKFRTKEDAYEFACLLRDTVHGDFANHG